MSSNESTDTDGDEEIDEDDQERINRVRGKRDSRRSRRDTEEADSSQAAQSKQAKQVNKEQQPQQAPQGQQGSKSEDTTTVTQQQQQAPQAEQATQEKQEKLEPVTQREHDTFYLSKELRTELNKRYRRMSLDILEETGVDIDDQQVGGQNRYFRPLALLLGAREIAEMSPAELRETIEQEELIDDLPAEE